MYNRGGGSGVMNHRGTTAPARGQNSAAAASATADVLEAQNEALLTNLQGKISNLKNVSKAEGEVYAGMNRRRDAFDFSKIGSRHLAKV